MILSSDEYDLLDKIASETKMDCWFMIKQSPKSGDYVFDLENGKRMSLRTGIRQLLEGIEGMEDEYMDEQEKITMIRLLATLL